MWDRKGGRGSLAKQSEFQSRRRGVLFLLASLPSDLILRSPRFAKRSPRFCLHLVIYVQYPPCNLERMRLGNSSKICSTPLFPGHGGYTKILLSSIYFLRLESLCVGVSVGAVS